MKTDCQKYLIFLSIMLFLTWTLSCSGRSGKMNEAGGKPAAVLNEEVTARLIKIVSPEENAGFKLNQPVKLTLVLEDKKTVPDSVTVYFSGNYVTTFKSGPWEYSIPLAFTASTGRKSLKVTAYKGGKLQNTITPVSYTHLRAHETRQDIVC